MIDHAALSEGVRRAGLGNELHPIRTVRTHANRHFVSRVAGRPVAFVKVYRGKAMRRRAELAVNPMLVSSGLPTPRLLAADVEGAIPWAAFDWHDLREIAFDEHGVARASGELLRRLHATAVPPAIRARLQRYRAPALLLREAAALTVGSPYERLLRTLLGGRVPEFGPPVLLHGDYGARNLALGEDGALRVLDFEHARLGPAVIDFAKSWDRELAPERSRREFLEGYGDPATHDPLALLWIRTWALALLHDYGLSHADSTAISDSARALAVVEREIVAL